VRIGGLAVAFQLQSKALHVFVRHVLQVLVFRLEAGDFPPIGRAWVREASAMRGYVASWIVTVNGGAALVRELATEIDQIALHLDRGQVSVRVEGHDNVTAVQVPNTWLSSHLVGNGAVTCDRDLQ
jgi:hypothetical protein